MKKDVIIFNPFKKTLIIKRKNGKTEKYSGDSAVKKYKSEVRYENK